MARNGKKTTSFYNWPKFTKGQGPAEKNLALTSGFIWKVLPLIYIVLEATACMQWLYNSLTKFTSLQIGCKLPWYFVKTNCIQLHYVLNL